MNIALDYDRTYTRDPQMWRDFVAVARQAGHAVWIVTQRRAQFEPVEELALRAVNRVIYTEREAKGQFVTRLGLKIDVWIDDTPEFIWPR